MQRCVLPDRMTAERLVELALASAEIANYPGGILLDAERTSFWSPLGVCMLAAAVEQRRLRGWPWPGFVPPEDPGVWKFLRETHVMQYLEGRGAPPSHPSDTLSIRHLRSLEPQWVSRIANWIAEQVGGGEDLAYLVEMQLLELLTNVFDHALSGIGCFALARWYGTQGNVRVAVVDGGMGIPASLRRHFTNFVTDDDTALIERAVQQEGLTTRVGRTGGLGLKNILGSVIELGGEIVVTSGSAAVRFAVETRRQRVEYFQGTAVELNFRPQLSEGTSHDEG